MRGQLEGNCPLNPNPFLGGKHGGGSGGDHETGSRRPRLNVQARTARQHPDGRPDGVAGWVGRVGRTHAEDLGEGRTLSCAPFDRCGVPDETQGSVPRCSEISHGPNPADAILAFPVKVYLYGLRGPSRSAKTVS